jgi:hypothetical protein
VEEEQLLEEERRLHDEIKTMIRLNKLRERKAYFDARHKANMEAVVKRAALDAENLAEGKEPTKHSSALARLEKVLQAGSKYYNLPKFSSDLSAPSPNLGFRKRVPQTEEQS